MSKRKADCTPEEWAVYRSKERQRKAKPSNKEAMRVYEQRPDVLEKRRAYNAQRSRTPERKAYAEKLRQRPDLREKRRDYMSVYNADPRVKEERRAYNLQKLYGIDAAVFARLLAVQRDSCAVCRRPFSNSAKNSKPHVDHCHLSGLVRGILCGPCNSIEGLIGRAGLTPEQFAERLTAYLTNPPADQVKA